MSVTQLQAMGGLTEKPSLLALTSPGKQIFEFSQSHNSVLVENGLVTQIQILEFRKEQDIAAKKKELIGLFGAPSHISEDSSTGSLNLYWGAVKPSDQGYSAKGQHVSAKISRGMTQVSIVQGNSAWEEYTPAIAF